MIWGEQITFVDLFHDPMTSYRHVQFTLPHYYLIYALLRITAQFGSADDTEHIYANPKNGP